MARHYQVWYDGRFASLHLTRKGAEAEIGRLTLKGWYKKFELIEGCKSNG